MDIFDYLVFIFYVVIFYLIFVYRQKKYNIPEIRKYYKYGFWVKVAGAFAYSLFVLNSVPGDTSFLYYPFGMNLYKIMLHDFSNLKIFFTSAANFDESFLGDVPNVGYMTSDSNFIIVKIVALIGFLTFGKFMAINLFFSIIAFTGMWRLFLFFNEQFPKLHKGFAIALLFLPNMIFWSSGILKDPICLGALGWITYSTYHLFFTKGRKIKNLIALIIFGYLLFTIKIYIFLSYYPFLLLYLIFKYLSMIRLNLKKVLIVSSLIATGIFIYYKSSDATEMMLSEHLTGDLIQSVMSYQESYSNLEEKAGSNFSLGVEFDGTVSSFIKMAPAAMFATLYRPFVWEAKKATALAASLESLFILLFTIFVFFRAGPFKFFITIIKRPIILYCLLFALSFSVFIGATTPNFGSLVRYKTPAIPFYIISLIFILYYNNKLKSVPYKKEADPIQNENSIVGNDSN